MKALWIAKKPSKQHQNRVASANASSRSGSDIWWGAAEKLTLQIDEQNDILGKVKDVCIVERGVEKLLFRTATLALRQTCVVDPKVFDLWSLVQQGQQLAVFFGANRERMVLRFPSMAQNIESFRGFLDEKIVDIQLDLYQSALVEKLPARWECSSALQILDGAIPLPSENDNGLFLGFLE